MALNDYYRGMNGSGFEKTTSSDPHRDVARTAFVGDLAEESTRDSSPPLGKRRSRFARFRGYLHRRRLGQPSISGLKNSRIGLLGPASRVPTLSDVSSQRSPRRMTVSATTRPISLDVEQDGREGESMNANPNLDSTERHLIGYGAPGIRDTRISSAPSEPSSSASLPACQIDACHNPPSSSRSGHLVEDRRSTRDLFGSEREEALINVEARLDSLENGCLFAARYRIQPERNDGNPHCRCAVERSTGQEVLLEFFPGRLQEFENAVRAHRALQNGHKYVCRMLDSMESIHGFPPCLVLERGHHTLADEMLRDQISPIEQRAILYSVLEALEYIHSQGIVHGDLDPTHIMWFPEDFSWKLVDFSKALPTGEPAVQPNAGRYACPELSPSLMKGHESIFAKPSMDMWSFGLVAFELLTSSNIRDAGGVVEFIERQLGHQTVFTERTVKRWLSANRRGRTEDGLDLQNFQFVRSLLRRDPKERRTAMEVLEDVFFRSATDMYQRADLSGEEGATLTGTQRQDATLMVSEHLLPGLDPQQSLQTVINAVHHHLTRDLEIQLFGKDSDPSLPFYKRKTEEPLVFFDHRIQHEPVYILRLAESFRLRMHLSYGPQLRLPIEGIASVTVKVPDAGEHSLDVVQWVDNGSITALISFDPKRILSQKLNSISPFFGSTDRTYVKISVYTKLQIADSFDHDLELSDCFYCKIVHYNNQLRLHKLLGIFVTKEERLHRQSGRIESAY